MANTRPSPLDAIRPRKFKGKPTVHFEIGKCQELWETVKTTLPRPKLIVCNPPHNAGRDYGLDHAGSKIRDDLGTDIELKKDEYYLWFIDWLKGAWALLDPAGSMLVIFPPEHAYELHVFMRRELRANCRGNIIWHDPFSQYNVAASNLTHSHHIIGYYSKSSVPAKITFNKRAVSVPSSRLVIYKDIRGVEAEEERVESTSKEGGEGKVADDVWFYHKDEIAHTLTGDQTVISMSRVMGTWDERCPAMPSQSPFSVMNRLVLMASRPGDWVLDPFCGSGTVGVAATRGFRNFCGIDRSTKFIEFAAERIDKVIATLPPQYNKDTFVWDPLSKPLAKKAKA